MDRQPTSWPDWLSSGNPFSSPTMAALFLHTHFHKVKVSYVLFREMAEEKLGFEQQTLLKTLGIKF
jgi:hypothetical protein